MSIKKRSIYYSILFIFCFIDLEFFYLIDTAEFSLLGMSYTDFVFSLNVSLVLFELIRNKGKMIVGVSIKVLIGFCLLVISAAVAGNLSYDQPIILGIAAQREWISCILILYPIFTWLKNKKITVSGLKKVFYFIALVYVFICILQYIFADTIEFTFVEKNSRYSENRFYFETTYLAFMSAVALDDFLERESKNRQKYLIMLVAILFVYIFVTKGRMGVISWIAATSISIMLHARKNITRKILYCVIITVGIILFLNTTMGQDIIETIFWDASTNDTLSVRSDGRIYYIALLVSSAYSVIFGYGMPNTHWNKAQSITNPLWSTEGTARLYLEDQGIIGKAFIYGAIGIVFWCVVTGYCLVLAYRLYKMTNKTKYLHWILLDLFGCISLTPSMFYNSLVFSLVFAMLIYEYYSIKIPMDKSDKILAMYQENRIGG